MEALARPAHGARAEEQGGELVVRQLVEDGGEVAPALRGDPGEELAAGGGRGDADDAAVRVLPAPFHEASLLHAVDDAGRAGLGHVERLGEGTHRDRPLLVQDRQHVEVDEAEWPRRPAAQVAHDAGRRVRGELVEELADQGRARGGRHGSGEVDGQHRL